MIETIKKILIIDDSNTNVVLMEAILNSKGYQVLTAFTVKQARSIISNELPALILLDLLMPQTSGYQFLEDIKKDEATKDIPVIVVSAVSDLKNKKKTMVLGAIDYVEKPVDIHELVEKVELTLKN